MKHNLAFSEETYKDLIENASEMISCMDREGNFTYVNKAWKETMGYDEKEIDTLSFLKILHPDCTARCTETFYKLLSGEDVGTVEGIFVRKDGSRLYFEGSSKCRLSSDGQNTSLKCVLRDVSYKKQTERQLAALASVVENSNDMIAVKDLDLTIIAANEAYAKAAGCGSIEEIAGKTSAEIWGFSRESNEAMSVMDLDRKAQKLARGEFLLVDVEPCLPLAKGKCLTVKKYPIFDKSGKLIGTGDIFRDVTEIKNFERNLKESEENLRLILADMTQGIALCEIICDKSGDPVDYKFLKLNNKFEEQTGFKTEDLAGKTLLEIFPETEKSWIKKFGEVALKGASLKCEHYFPKFDKWYWVSAYSHKQGQFVVTMEDMTDRKNLEESLFLEKERMKTTLLSVGDGVITTDKSGKIRLMNKAAEKMTEFTLDMSIGKPLKEIFNLINELTGEGQGIQTEKVLKRGEILNLSDHRVLISRSGKKIYIEDSAAPIKDRNGEISGMIVVFRDSTEKIERQKEVEFLSLHDHLTGLYNRRYMQDSINRLDTARNLPLCAVYSDINGLKIINDCFGHETGDKQLKKVADTLRCILRSDDIIGRVGGDEFLVLLPKTGEDVAKSIVERSSNSFKNTDTDPVSVSLAIGFSIKTDPAQQIDDIIKRAEDNMYKDKLKSGKIMRKKMVENILMEINRKYENERIHSKRVTEYCLKTARAMGLCREELAELKAEAILHDIGKIVIPKNIIIKPDKLSEEEYELVKRHSEKGYQILKSIDEYATLAESVLQHHERWDGKGYPDGLKEENILLHSRIINLAEAYEAMTSDRPYKKAMTQKEAVDELKECRGKQFDPEIVDIFIEKVLQYNDQ